MEKSNYKKTLVSTDWYHAKITATKVEEKYFGLCFTIDVGKSCYRNIWTFFDYTVGLDRVVNLFDGVGYIIVNDVENPLFQEQFMGLRFKISVGRRIKDKFIVNEILEMQHPTEIADYDVSKPRTDDHFFKTGKKRKLPIL